MSKLVDPITQSTISSVDISISFYYDEWYTRSKRMIKLYKRVVFLSKSNYIVLVNREKCLSVPKGNNNRKFTKEQFNAGVALAILSDAYQK